MSHAPNNHTPPSVEATPEQQAQPARCALATGSASAKPYDPLDSLEKEVERFMETNLFTPMEVTGFYIQARCVISELRGLRKENEYLRNVRERQSAIIRQRERDVIELEEQVIALQPNHGSEPRRTGLPPSP